MYSCFISFHFRILSQHVCYLRIRSVLQVLVRTQKLFKIRYLF